MGRRPRWMKSVKARYLLQGQTSRPPASGGRYILGGLITLVGAGIVLAAIPGWMYLLLFGAGILGAGVYVLKS